MDSNFAKNSIQRRYIGQLAKITVHTFCSKNDGMPSQSGTRAVP